MHAVARGKLKKEGMTPVVGDNVEIEGIGDGKYMIMEVKTRRSYLKRPKVSNVTQVVIVITPKMPRPNFVTLDKLLCQVKFLRLKELIVINKANLNPKKSDEIFELYRKARYRIMKMNAEDDDGIEELKERLKNNTTVLAGQSGVRKIYDYKQDIKQKS